MAGVLKLGAHKKKKAKYTQRPLIELHKIVEVYQNKMHCDLAV